ncbi:MAG: TonB-dependent receptor [Pseudomonadota bacterium]
MKLAEETGLKIIAPSDLVGNQQAPSIAGSYAPAEALEALLAGSNLMAVRSSSGAYVVMRRSDSTEQTRKNDQSITPAPEASKQTIEELKVIGQRYGQESTRSVSRVDMAIREIPNSVTVITAANIEDRAAVTIEEIVGTVAGVTPARESFTLRGILNDSGLSSTNRLNGFAGDVLPDRDYYTLERVEVIKGPAAISGGFVNPGGFINSVLKTAAPDNFASITAQATDFGQYRLQGDLNRTVGQRSSIRLVAAGLTGDTFVDDVELDSLTLLPSFQTKLSDKTTVSGWLSYQKEDGDGFIGHPINFASTPLIDPDFNFDYDGDDFEQTDTQLGGEIVHQFLDDLSLTLRIADGSTDIRTQAVYAYSYDFVRGIPEDGQVYVYATDRDSELSRTTGDLYLTKDFSLAGGKSSVIIGSEFLDVEVDNFSAFQYLGTDNIFAPGEQFNYPAGPLNNILRQGTIEATLNSAYVQTILRPLEGLVVSAGLRHDAFENQNFSPAGLVSEQKETELTGNIGISFRIEGINSNIYGSYSTGFTPSAFGQTVDGELLDPETSRQVELGIKTDLAGGRAVLTLATYRLVQDGTPIEDPNNRDFQINGGEVTVDGIEIELAGELFPGFDVSAGIAFTDPEITKGVPGFGGALEVGDRPEYATTRNAGAVVSYKFADGIVSGLRVGGSLRHVSERARSATRELEAFTIGGLFAEYTYRNVEVGLFVANVTDEAYVEYSNVPNYTFLGVGRNWTFRMSYDF